MLYEKSNVLKKGSIPHCLDYSIVPDPVLLSGIQLFGPGLTNRRGKYDIQSSSLPLFPCKMPEQKPFFRCNRNFRWECKHSHPCRAFEALSAYFSSFSS
ncbi:hypothetical protein D3C80_1424850 [compost metagenome]